MAYIKSRALEEWEPKSGAPGARTEFEERRLVCAPFFLFVANSQLKSSPINNAFFIILRFTSFNFRFFLLF